MGKSQDKEPLSEICLWLIKYSDAINNKDILMN